MNAMSAEQHGEHIVLGSFLFSFRVALTTFLLVIGVALCFSLRLHYYAIVSTTNRVVNYIIHILMMII
eukprot:COSAG06_NODE_3195_length_5703_cov_94.949143_6_plen_68_part_00